MRIHNTLTKKVEKIELRHKNRIDMFVCGPTVYDYSHIGHARSYVDFDAIVKFFRCLGYSVFYIQNITDIDDKIIKKAQDENKQWFEISRKFEKEYLKDMEKLRVNSVNLYARATEHIPEIISQVQRLIEKGYGYKTKDGIYFDISKFKDYGKLSGQSLENLKMGARIEVNEDKRHPYDFALWKFKKEGEPFWKAPFGDGRPGWHIEDTAIGERYHGYQYDIHGGGLDLIFPHHESEIAQMEALSGKVPYVRYWVHNGFVNVNKEKMSKSLGNFMTIRDLLQKVSPEGLRYFIIINHYHAPVDFNMDAVENADKRLEDIQRTIDILMKKENKVNDEVENKLIKEYKNFFDALADDFNTAKANESFNRIIGIINKEVNKDGSARDVALEIVKDINSIFDVLSFESKTEVSGVIDDIIALRNELRKEKNYEVSDKIRDILNKNNIEILDSKEGTEWRIK